MPDPVTHSTPTALKPYDALLVLSYGGPNKPDDVMPFLRNVVRGKNIPDERLAEVAEHYLHFDGKSPINEQNLALIDAIRGELDERGIDLPVMYGNRYWTPFSVDTLRDAEAFGAKRVLALITSAYASYSGTRQYQEHLAEALTELGSDIQIDVLAPFYNTPGFVQANTDAILAALGQLSEPGAGAHLLFVTHSIPLTMEKASGATGPSYLQQHEDVRANVVAEVQRAGYQVNTSLAYCSRSGSPHVPWLEPDINDELARLSENGVTKVVIAPIGFISDHMEVLFDLDTEAMQTAADLGLEAVRAGTSGVQPVFVSQLVDLVERRAARECGQDAPVPVVGQYPVFDDVAPSGACFQRHGVVTGLPVVGAVD